jgi:hypothetical protein
VHYAQRVHKRAVPREARTLPFPSPNGYSPRHRAGATSDADISTFRGAPRRNTRRAAFVGHAKATQRLVSAVARGVARSPPMFTNGNG